VIRIASALLLVASLHGQQVTQEQLGKLYSQMDDAIGLHPGVTIADIGTGFAVDHALQMAEKVAPGGKIVCVDVRQSVLTKVKEQADARHIANLEVVLGSDDDPKLSPAVFDVILVSNTYHEFTQPEAMLKRLCAALKPGGILVIVENCSIAHRGDSRAAQTKLHDISPELLEGELKAEGLRVKQRIEPILVESPDRFRYLFAVEKTQ
jgi:ubiquinone/menaquinone biosynthesis C-methylase UbiE